MNRPVVAKVGGSLFDLPDLRDRLRYWLHRLEAESVVIVPGGGPSADAFRRLHHTHGLTQETSHGLAIRAMSVNGHFLASLLDVPVIATLENAGAISVLDAYEFCSADQGRAGELEHTWRVTSDAIAARVAAGGGHLHILKSTHLPIGVNWADAAQAGLVDGAFGEVVAAGGVVVTWVNLRDPKYAMRI